MNLDDVIQQPGQSSRMLRDAIMDGLHVSVPGQVVSYDPNKGTATIQPTVRRFGKSGPPPLLMDVPVFFPGNYIFPVNPGDEALVVFSDGCIDAWYQSGGVSTAMSARSHSLSDGFAFVGFRSAPNMDKGVDIPNSFWGFKAGTAIPANSDLDSYTKPGNFRVESGSIASTISNCPVGSNPFLMKVFESQEEEVLVQWVIQGNCQRMFMRRYANNAFTDWVKYTTENATTSVAGLMSAEDKTELDAFAAYGVRAKGSSETDIDQFLTAGVYWIVSTSQTGGTWPIDTTIGTRYAVLEVMRGGSNGNVGIQRMTVYDNGLTYERIYANSRWYPWNCPVSLNWGYSIGANSDLNDYTDIGNFRVTQASVATTIANTPISDHGYLLKVMKGAMSGITIQMAISGVGDTMHIRIKNGSAWDGWRKYTSVRNDDFAENIPSNSNLDNYTTVGHYRVAQASVAATIANTPITSSGYLLNVINGAMADVLLQIVLKSDGSQMYARYKTGSVWSSWSSYLTNVASTTLPGYMSATDKSAFDNSTVRGKGSTTETNLDNLKVSGTYWLSSTQTSGWPSQEPTNRNGVLTVYYDGGGARIQDLTMYNGLGENTKYTRMFINSRWYPWRQIVTGDISGNMRFMSASGKSSYTITVPSSSAHLLVINTNATGAMGTFQVAATSGGVVASGQLYKGGSLTQATGTNKITVTLDSARPIYIQDICTYGTFCSVA